MPNLKYGISYFIWQQQKFPPTSITIREMRIIKKNQISPPIYKPLITLLSLWTPPVLPFINNFFLIFRSFRIFNDLSFYNVICRFITDICNFQLGITNLQKIFVQYCKIRDIEASAFNKLTNLVELDLGENLIQVLRYHTRSSI